MNAQHAAKIIANLEDKYHWSMMRGGCGIHVNVDGKTCLVCPTVESALKQLMEACRARNRPLSAANRSPSKSVRDE
jgi:hypothetical protein